MNSKNFDDFWATTKPELVELIKGLIPTIEDDFRVSDDPDDDTPGIQITISCNEDCTRWSYQTGDNSYTGSCYGDPYWGIGYIFRDSKPEDVASELIADLSNQIDEWND